MVRLLTSHFEQWTKQNISNFSPPIPFVVIGYPDTGAPEGYEKNINPTVNEIIAKGEHSFVVENSKNTVHCVNETFSYLYEHKQDQLKLIVEPRTIRRFLIAMSQPMSAYKEHEVGAGYIDEKIAIDYWANFTPKTLLQMQFPNATVR